MSKYASDQNEGGILPNLLNLEDKNAVDRAEFEGLLYAEISMSNALEDTTILNAAYIREIHLRAFKHLYGFAGNYRTVNISKGGFSFPPARFLDQTMRFFEKDILLKLPNTYTSKDDLITDLATVHAELLFIHPFREGNGRTARILANLMVYKQGYEPLHFEKIDQHIFPEYVAAVQAAAMKNYKPMKGIFNLLF